MINDPLDVFFKDFAEDEDLVFEWTNGDDEPESATTKGIFDNSFVDANIGETVLDATSPRITCPHADVANVQREATVTVKGKLYSVTQVQPDGTGCAIVTLALE